MSTGAQTFTSAAKIRFAARLKRDQQQRDSNNKKNKHLYKEIPKAVRKAQIDVQRRNKEEAYSFVEEQGFSPLLAGVVATNAVSFVAGIVANKISRTKTSVEKFVDTLNEKLQELVSLAKRCMGKMWVVPVGVVAHYLFSQYLDIPLFPALCSAVLVKIFGKDIWETIKSYFTVQKQSGDSLCEAGGLVASLFCLCFVPVKSAASTAGELIRRAGSFPRAKEGFEMFFKLVMKYLEKLVNVFMRMTGKEELKWMDQSENLVSDFSRKVDAFERKTRDTKNIIGIEELLAAAQLQIDAIGLKATVRSDYLRNKVEKALSRLTLLLMPYQGAITAARNYRIEPQFLCLYGKTAMGKTSLVTKLACAILVKSGLCDEKTALRNLWQKGTTEYWNGYANQKCLIMDDCFQVKPVKGDSDNEYMNVVRMVGNWAFALNFADLESKGKFYFDTPLIIGTTNVADVRNQAEVLINEPEAVVRRIKYPYRISVTPEYQVDNEAGVDKLDYAKVEREFARRLDCYEQAKANGQDTGSWIDCYPWEAWELTLHDFSRPQEGGATRTVKSLIEEIVSNIKTSKETHDVGLRNLDRFLRGMSEEFKLDSNVAMDSVSQPVDFDEDGGSGSGVLQELVEPNAPIAQADVPAPIEIEAQSGFGDQGRVNMALLRAAEERAMPDSPPSSDDESEEEEEEFVPQGQQARHWAALREALMTHLRQLRERFGGNPFNFVWNLDHAPGPDGMGRVQLWLLDVEILMMMAIAFNAVVRVVTATSDYLFGKRAKKQSNVKAPAGVPKKVYFARKLREEGMIPARYDSNVVSKIYCNTFKLVVGDGPSGVDVGQVTFIQHTLAMMPKHFTRELRKHVDAGKFMLTDSVTLINPSYDLKYSFLISEFLGFPRLVDELRDMEFVNFPRGSILARKKITQFFLTEAQYQDVIRAKPAVRLDVFIRNYVRDTLDKERRVMQTNTFEYLRNLSTEGYDNQDLLSYNLDTSVGMCGAPLTIENNVHWGGRCYLGMHVAGTQSLFGRKGFAQIVTLEDLEVAIKHFKVTDDKFTEDATKRDYAYEDVEDSSAGLQSGLIKGSFGLLGELGKPVNLGVDTKLKLSTIGEVELFGPCPNRPAALRPAYIDGEKVFPMLRGLEAYTTSVEYKEIPLARLTMNLATKPFRERSQNDWRGIMSKEEAVRGIEGLKIKAINRSTSAGFPYILECKSGKKEFFGDADFDFSSEQCSLLFKRVEDIISAAKENTRLAHVFTDFLKDEMRPHAKVDALTTRIISGAPLDYVVAFRMYFGAFMASMFKHHTSSGMAPGINPYAEWWMLASNLSRHGPKVFDGDFKRFDASEQPHVLWLVLDFVNQWYDDGEENAQIRSILWLDLVHSRHVGGNGTDQRYIYQWNKSLPSGHPFTTPANSLYSLFTLTACYVRATGDFKNMWDHVYIATFGDDNIVNVDDTVSEDFNQVTVAHHMMDLFKLTYTAGSKDSELLKYTTLDKCTFLKRRFVRDALGSGGWTAPLDLNSFLYSAYYYRNNRNKNEDIRKSLEDMLGELSLHDQATWDKYFPLVKDALADGGMTTNLTDRSAYREYMSSRVDAWF